jgi:5-formyltetrahydrofolate cyclo-ligase
LTLKSKLAIRKQILKLLRNQKEEDRCKKSLVILRKFFAIKEVKLAKTILFYVAFDGEVETLGMIKRACAKGKKVAVPTIHKENKMIIPTLIRNCEEDLELGPYGIHHPKHNPSGWLKPEHLDLVVVPGVAFDKNGHRLGRGAGYYDRFIARLPKDVPTVGLAFDFQVVDQLPHQEHDMPVSRVIHN